MSKSFACFLLHLESNMVNVVQVSLKNGAVQGFDIQATASDSSSGPKPCFTLHAHDKAVSSISYIHQLLMYVLIFILLYGW